MAGVLEHWCGELEAMRSSARMMLRGLSIQTALPLRRRGLVAAELRRIASAARIAAAVLGDPRNEKPEPQLGPPDEAVRGCGRVRLLDSSGEEIGTVHDVAMLEDWTDQQVFSAVGRGRKINGILYLLRKPHLAARDAEGDVIVTDAPATPPGQAIGYGSGDLPPDSDGVQGEFEAASNAP